METTTTGFVLLDDGAQRRTPLRQSLLVACSFLAGSLATIWLASPASAAGIGSPSLTARQSSPPPDDLATCGHQADLKRVVCRMDHALVGLGDQWRNYSLFDLTMRRFWSPGFTYTPMHGLTESKGMRDWFDKEMSAWTDAFPWVTFQQMIFVGSGPNASSTTYAVGTWERPLGLLQPTKRRMTVRITDFYLGAPDGRIAHNWMMIDVLDLLRQQGIVPLPLSPLPQGRISPPQGDAIPAPLARYATRAHADAARRLVSAMLQREWVEGSYATTSTPIEPSSAQPDSYHHPPPPTTTHHHPPPPTTTHMNLPRVRAAGST